MTDPTTFPDGAEDSKGLVSPTELISMGRKPGVDIRLSPVHLAESSTEADMGAIQARQRHLRQRRGPIVLPDVITERLGAPDAA